MTFSIKPNDIDSYSVNSLVRRVREDQQRDPVDALQDAEILYETLCDIRDLLESPCTSFTLSSRLREDLANGDRIQAAERALLLLKESRLRASKVIDKGIQNCQELTGLLNKSNLLEGNLC